MEELIEKRARYTLDKVMLELGASGRPLPAHVIYLVPGESVVWDNRCCEGQLSARLTTLAAHRTASVRPVTLTPCSIDYWTATLEVTLLRCAATIDNAGNAPSPGALLADGQSGLGDTGAMLRALTRVPFIDDVTSWTPQGPSGGCMGVTWTVTFKVDATPCDGYEDYED